MRRRSGFSLVFVVLLIGVAAAMIVRLSAESRSSALQTDQALTGAWERNMRASALAYAAQRRGKLDAPVDLPPGGLADEDASLTIRPSGEGVIEIETSCHLHQLTVVGSERFELASPVGEASALDRHRP
jgi:hypothetical protein